MYQKFMDGFKGEKAITIPHNTTSYLSNNWITKQLYTTHIGYYPKAKHHYRERTKGTNENVLIYCSKGQGWIEFNEQKFTLRENSLFILPENKPHSYGSNTLDPWSIYWFHFKGTNANMFEPIFGKLINIKVTDKSRVDDRLKLFNEIYQNLEMGYSPENMEYITFCLMHFLSTIQYISQYREVESIKESDAIQKCIRFMKDNLEKKITLKDIADSIGYSSSHLNTLFVKRTSISPIEYYNQIKIQRACSYLQFSDLKIKEIAYRLKYYDQYHFSKVFKKEMNVTPKQYRSKYNDLHQ